VQQQEQRAEPDPGDVVINTVGKSLTMVRAG
jgi:hypothetical protein